MGEQEWADPEPNVENRLQRLERVMLAINDQRTEGFRLAESVDRLGLNAGALQEALLQVDRNQQTLTRLGKELEETKATVVPRAEHQHLDEVRQQELREYRQTLKTRLYTWSVAALAGLLVLGVLGANYLNGSAARARAVCEERNVTMQAQRDYLKQVAENSTNPVLARAATEAVNSWVIADCDALR
jgi:hypothetical protein